MITLDEKIEIARHLESSHSLFRKFWDLGEPSFTDKIPTAAVTFNESGEFVEFLFNKSFWDKLPAYDRAFVCAHEMLHILLEHGFRINSKNSDKEIANKAMDICVNSLLVNQFGFERDKLQVEKILGCELCWFENIFFNSQKVKKNREAEYYYNILMKLRKAGKDDSFKDKKVLDAHMNNEKAKDLLDVLLPGAKDEILSDQMIRSIVKDYTENENNIEMNALCNLAGNSTGSWQKLEDQKMKFSKKWNSIIKKKDIERMVDDFVEEESFVRRNKRFEYALGNDVLIPTDTILEKRMLDKDKTRLIMFLDTSGSCLPFVKDFFLAYKTIDPKRFEIEIFSFDTKIEKIDVDNQKIYAGGGTHFHILDHRVQQIFKYNKLNHQPHVFVLTDGYGTYMKCVAPKNWHFFLTQGGCKSFIPAGSHIHQIDDFVY